MDYPPSCTFFPFVLDKMSFNANTQYKAIDVDLLAAQCRDAVCTNDSIGKEHVYVIVNHWNFPVQIFKTAKDCYQGLKEFNQDKDKDFYSMVAFELH
jgi:adenosine/AMP kinase